MIILNLRGGLGNQLFQFSYAYILSKRHGNEKIFLSTFYQKREPINRGICLNRLKCDGQFTILPMIVDDVLSIYLKLKKEIVKKIIGKDKVTLASMAKYGIYVADEIYRYQGYPDSRKWIKNIDGYFQSARYFGRYAEELKKILLPKTCGKKNSLIQTLEKEINGSNSICLHIRRGDYTSDQWRSSLLICDEQYYIKAIRYMKEKVVDPIFFVFTNSTEDIDWVRDNYHLEDLASIYYVDSKGTDIDDFDLMINCKHFILSNSSFSWWAQYLSKSEDKIVVAPSRWTNERQDDADVYIDGWIKIKV